MGEVLRHRGSAGAAGEDRVKIIWKQGGPEDDTVI